MSPSNWQHPPVNNSTATEITLQLTNNGTLRVRTRSTGTEPPLPGLRPRVVTMRPATGPGAPPAPPRPLPVASLGLVFYPWTMDKNSYLLDCCENLINTHTAFMRPACHELRHVMSSEL